MRLRHLFGAGTAAATLLLSSSVFAQSSGFSLNRFDPSERGSDWFALESLDFRGHVRPVFGVVGDWGYKPLVAYDANGDEQAAIVEHQVFAHVGGGINLWDKVRLAASLPLLVVNQGESVGSTTQSSFSSQDGGGLGDLRLGADVGIVGEYGEAFALAGGVQVHIPTGDRESFASDGKVRIVPRLMAAGDVGNLAYAVRAGVNVRTQTEDFDGEPFGSEVQFAASVGVRLAEKKLLIGPELYGSTVVADGDAVFARKTTPVEAIIGGHYRAGDFKFGLGVGPGLTRGYGTPVVRVLGSIEWFPEVKKEEPKPEEPKDRDGDGIIDDEDACPDTPGVASDDPEKNGCPLPGDRDNDGIIDDEDACPDTPGEANDDPAKNGCPPPADRDKDGIIDDEDACPDEPGEANDDPAKNGCPPPKDTDGDGILDPEDACPKEAGKPNKDPKKHGCPKAQIVKGQIKILEQVKFKTASAKILPESDELLTAVAKILKDHPEIKLVSVEGHTDSRGSKRYNTGLSRRRAASVVKWLTSHGIDKKRLTSNGFGPSKPIDTNDTEEGRRNNRRVEFHIKKQDGATTVKTK